MRPFTMNVVQDMREQNILALEHAKRDNRKVVGMYCAFAPQELALAAGAIPVSLCGARHEPIAAAEKTLPRNLCPLIKSSFGFAITDTCPYFRFSDFIVAETTCDGKKKMFEILREYKPIHMMHLPQGTDRPAAVAWWLKELKILKERLEENLGVEITRQNLREAIKLCNRERLVMKRLHEMNRLDPAPLAGLDMLTAIWMKGFNVDKEDGINQINQLIGEIEEIAASGQSPFRPGAPRVLLTGCPVGIGSEKVVRLVEECGGAVVCFESCSGIKTMENLVDEDEEKDPLEAIAECYLKIPCSVMTPNPGRFELLGRLISDYQVDGVIDLTWQACHTYIIEDVNVRNYVKDNFGISSIQLETDYSNSDLEQLKTRISAFIEMISGQ
ncbi:MAG: R-phenyllactate dehydratase beta subunit [Firmicutes bacterium ADurb.Bin373]|nr:2-hydroxyacyl-CoA dehydratase [Bacillota bacterium]OQA10510.1 MAG: R-phenyllactate dehydratase beta subunit [Firmicutes bacterium ADurb.Bin373]